MTHTHGHLPWHDLRILVLPLCNLLILLSVSFAACFSDIVSLYCKLIPDQQWHTKKYRVTLVKLVNVCTSNRNVRNHFSCSPLPSWRSRSAFNSYISTRISMKSAETIPSKWKCVRTLILIAKISLFFCVLVGCDTPPVRPDHAILTCTNIRSGDSKVKNKQTGSAIKHWRTAGDTCWHEIINQEEPSGGGVQMMTEMVWKQNRKKDEQRGKQKKRAATVVACAGWISFTWMPRRIFFLSLMIWFRQGHTWCMLGKNTSYLLPTSDRRGEINPSAKIFSRHFKLSEVSLAR